MADEYIKREAVLKLFDKVGCYLNPKCLERQQEQIKQLPADDVVSVADIEQLLWERNFAIEMLEKHGVKTAQEFIKSKFPYKKPKTELIDRRKIRYCWQVDADGEEHDGVTLQSIIDKMPTVDAVEVVRCKDCWKREKQCFDKTLNDDDFCSYGERRCKNA